MKLFWKETNIFLILSFFTWILLLFFILSTNKIELHLFINQWHSNAADFFFKYYTHVGGSVPFFVIVGFLFYKYRMALFLLISQLITALFTYPLKKFFDVDRPRRVLESLDIEFYRVEGVKLHGSNSFPSGHTTSAFALFFALTIIVKNPLLKILFFVLALLAGYSRVYLSQHFTEDILAGSILGVLSVYIAYIVFYKKTKDNHLLSKSLKDIQFK